MTYRHAEAPRAEDIEGFRSFAAAWRWRFAKTYVDSYPHEYTLQAWGDADAFWRAVLCIERWGVVESFWGSRRKYLYVDERKYWVMGDASSDKADERPALINRTWLDVGHYRDEARALGRDEGELDALVARWRELLENARRG